ncbi:50S ribosomal protein L24 [Alkalibacterium sp. s-m-22]|jgi:large subunit ribosomal protein L24|uniref:Large ribosomal subunit protein uL24 n=2 Tax=Alkalibacterium TaxID=99906 RepID=A0A1G8XNV2_9LACT|nr:50S ribosomal protein L24 [Alkalibacterium thalassium]SDJ91565.1 large subunit ribosomal protein L24 [Alkalibacterium thalassium]
MFVKSGDKVRVLAGKDKGKEGTVLSAMPKQNKVIVEGINIMKKHTRPTGMGQEGGIVETEAPIHVSNVQLIDPKTGESTRVGYKIEDGKKVRYAKKSGEAL